jgi:hypothetical protein
MNRKMHILWWNTNQNTPKVTQHKQQNSYVPTFLHGPDFAEVWIWSSA